MLCKRNLSIPFHRLSICDVIIYIFLSLDMTLLPNIYIYDYFYKYIIPTEIN